VRAGVPAEVLERRPDLAAAAQRMLAAQDRRREAQLALLPRISLTAAGGTTTDAVKNLLNGDFGIWTLAANLAQPIFEGGRLLAERDVRVGQLEEAEANYVRVALEAFREVETALAVEGRLRRREEAERAASREAERALELALRQYTTGLTEYLFVLEAQRTYFTARNRLIETQREWLDNRVNLYLALGGDF